MNSITSNSSNPSLFKTNTLSAFKILTYFISIYLILIFLNLSLFISSIISAICIITAGILFYRKYKFTAFVFFILTLSTLTYLRFKNENIISELPYVKDQEVLINGTVKKIIYQNERFVRFLAECEINSKDIKNVKSNVIVSLIKHGKGELFNINPKVGNTFTTLCYLTTNKEKVFLDEFPTKLYASSMNANFVALSFASQFTITNNQPYIFKTIDNIRNNLENQILYLFPKDVSKLILAITIGQKNLLTADDKEKYSLTGTSHIIAVSGLHVAVIAGFIYFLTLGFKNRTIKSILNVLLIMSYVVITGLQDSAIRAAIMAIFVILSIDFRRSYDFRNIFSAAVLLFILIQPNIIFSISFQLSVFALTGIIFFYEKIENRVSMLLPNTRNFLIISILTTISATFLLNPISAFYFNNFSLTSLVANIYAIPLISLILVVSIPIILFSFFVPDITLILAKGITFLVRILNSSNDFLLQFDSFYFTGEETILYSLIFAFIILIIIYATSFKHLLIYSLSMCIILFNIHYFINEDNFKRKNFDYEFSLIKNENENYLILYDYDIKNKVDLDYDLYKNLIKDDKKVNLYFNGNNGQHLYDILKDKIEIDTFKIKEKITL